MAPNANLSQTRLDLPQCLGLGESEIFINTLEEFIAGFFRFTIIIGRDHSFSRRIKQIFVKLWHSFIDVEDLQGLGLFEIKEEMRKSSFVLIVLTQSGFQSTPG